MLRTPSSAVHNATPNPPSTFHQTFHFNNLSSPEFDLDNLLVNLTVIETDFDSFPAKFDSESKKVSHLLKNLDPPVRSYAAKLILQDTKLKNDYSLLKNSLLSSKNTKINLPMLRSEFFRKTQGNLNLKDYLEEMERLASLIQASEDDLHLVVFEGLNSDSKLFLTHHKMPDSYFSRRTDMLYFYEKFKNQQTIHVNNMGTKKGPLSLEEKNRHKHNNLCLYCASPDHLVSTCPIVPNFNKSSTACYFSIYIKLHNKDTSIIVKALLGSGADANFLSLDVAKHLGLPLGTGSTGVLGNNTTFEIFDCPEVKFSIGERQHNENFKITKTLAHPAVLGLPWWIKNKLTFNYETLTCNVDGSVLQLHD